jgi:phosphate transport system permease protein
MSLQLTGIKPLIRERSGVEKNLDTVFIGLTGICAFAIAGILVLITVQVAIEAVPAIKVFGLGFAFNQEWNPVKVRDLAQGEDGIGVYGVLPMIYGTLATSFIALFLAVPIGVGTAIFLSEGFLPISVRTTLIFLIELLAAIPSVVYGLWGIFVLIPLIKPVGSWLNVHLGWIPLFSTDASGPGLMPAALVVTIMILPLITSLSRDSLASLPPDLRQASMGLGATRWETIFKILLPAAFSGIIGAIILALGRAMGETMAVTMLIGNSNQISPSLFAPGNTISSLLANQFAEAGGLQVSALMYAALILFVLTLLVNVGAEWLVMKVKKF